MHYSKVLFLDIDGVIAISKDPDLEKALFLAGKYYPFDPACVAILNEILEKSGAEIVLSSTWRLAVTLPELHAIFRKNGVCKGPIATTPVQVTERGPAIQAFLTQNHVQKFAIADDDEIEGFGQKFVLINCRVGLTHSHAARILRILG